MVSPSFFSIKETSLVYKRKVHESIKKFINGCIFLPIKEGFLAPRSFFLGGAFRMVEHIFFDYGGLLFDYRFDEKIQYKAHCLAADYLTKKGYKLGSKEIEKAHDKVIREYLQNREKTLVEWSLEEIISKVLKELDVKGEIKKVSEIYKFNDHIAKPYPDTLEVVDALSLKYSLGIISNLPHDSLVYELDEHKLLDCFETIVMSHEVGVRKPHPRIYQEALRRAYANPEKSLFVSHEQKELEGAEDVGMKTYLVEGKDLKKILGDLA